MKKHCNHKNIAQKFLHSFKYTDPILIEYTYCVVCHTILSGSVKFQNIFSYPKKNTLILNTPKIQNTQSIKQTCNQQKALSCRQTTRMPNIVPTPDGVTLSNILKQKYNLLPNQQNIQIIENPADTEQTSTLKDAYSPDFDDTDDIDIFLK